jgi:hypothetical protein
MCLLVGILREKCYVLGLFVGLFYWFLRMLVCLIEFLFAHWDLCLDFRVGFFY